VRLCVGRRWLPTWLPGCPGRPSCLFRPIQPRASAARTAVVGWGVADPGFIVEAAAGIESA
jgi:hypothetical protein